MNIPQFTAQASLYRTSNRYRSLAFDRASPQRTVLVPQFGGPGFEGQANCFSDCRDKHPDWKAARCARSCNDYGIAGASSDSWFNDLLSNIGIDLWEGACSAMVNPYVCGKVADEIRRQS